MTSGDQNGQPGLRLLDSSIRGRLGPGQLGVIAARAGVGKSALLTHIALAEMLEDHPVLHVALDRQVHEVRELYDRMFDKAGRQGLLDASDAHRMQLERRRYIHSYLRQGFTADKLDEAFRFLGDVMEFRPHTVVLDGFPLEVASHDAVAGLREVARASETRIWLSALTHRSQPVDPSVGLPKPVDDYGDLFDVVLSLASEGDRMLLRLLHATDAAGSQLPLRLDPVTTLITTDT